MGEVDDVGEVDYLYVGEGVVVVVLGVAVDVVGVVVLSVDRSNRNVGVVVARWGCWVVGCCVVVLVNVFCGDYTMVCMDSKAPVRRNLSNARCSVCFCCCWGYATQPVALEIPGWVRHCWLERDEAMSISCR